MQPLMLLVLFAAADPQIVTKGEVRAGGPVIKLMDLPAQTATPDSPVTLTDGMRYVFDCKVECDVIQFPEGVLEKFDKSGPRDWTARFPGSVDESDKTFAGPFLYCLKPVVSASGEVKVIVIPRGYKDKAEWVTVKFAVNGARPPPGPTPDPVPDDKKPPIPGAGLRVLIIEETADRSKIPAEQLAILFDQRVRDYLNAKTPLGADGNTHEWRVFDQNTTVSSEAKIWQDAMKRKRDKLPWIIISNGKTGFEGPLPVNVNDTLTLLKKYGG